MGLSFVLIGILIIIVGTSMLAEPACRNAAKIEMYDSHRRTIESMDKTIRLQWQLNSLLRRRLGELPDPAPISITGLPDPTASEP